jgi:hypothetical protein
LDHSHRRFNCCARWIDRCVPETLIERTGKKRAMKYWEIIADNLSKAGWSWGCVSAIDANERAIWIVDPHRGDGKRFVVRADEKVDGFSGA